MEISKFSAQKKLSVLWFINAGVFTIIFVLFTVFDRFDTQASKGWEWYSQNLIPPLALMIGSFYININQGDKDKTVNNFYFKLCFGISIFYLALLYLTIFLAPVAFKYSNMSIIELFDNSKIYLVVVQGVLTYSLGLFFNK